MIIAGILILILLKRLYTIKNRDRLFVAVIIVLNFSLALFSLFVLSNEINDPHLYNTSGSDSLMYYKEALKICDDPSSFFTVVFRFAGGYIGFCFIILITSFSQNALIISIVNILIFQNIILIFYKILINGNWNRKVVFLALFLIAVNGNIIWTEIRILKDCFFLYLFLEASYSFIRIRSFTSFLAFLIKFVPIVLITPTIRPYSEFIIIVALTTCYFSIFRNRVSVRQYKIMTRFLLFFIFVFIISIGSYIYSNYSRLYAISNSLIMMAQSSSLHSINSYNSGNVDYFKVPIYTRFLIGFIRFTILPVPIKELFDNNVYTIEKILITFGAFLWWILYIFTSIAILLKFGRRKEKLNVIYFFLIFVIFMSSTYILIYAGTAESRLRMPLYILGTICFSYFYFNLSKKNKTVLLCISILITLLFNFLVI